MERPVIPVTSSEAFAKQPTFSDAEGAIEAYEGCPRRLQAEAFGERLLGLTISDYSYTNSSVEFLLSDQSVLVISLEGEIPQWNHYSPKNKEGVMICPETLLPEIILQWGSKEELWKRDELLASRIGKRIWLFSAGFVEVNLYIEGMDILEFYSLLDQSSDSLFLYWAKDD